MRFEVEKLEKEQEEFDALSQEQQLACSKDYETIEKQGLEFVKRRFLRDGLFEIKTNEVRSLFQYRENKVILIGLIYVKKTQKAPGNLIKLALKRLKEAGGK